MIWALCTSGLNEATEWRSPASPRAREYRAPVDMIVTEARMPKDVTASRSQDWRSRRRNNQVTRDSSCMKLSGPPGHRRRTAFWKQSLTWARYTVRT